MYYRDYSVSKFAKGGITTDVFQMLKKISEKDFDNGMSFEDGNKKISIQKKTNPIGYNVRYYEKNDKNKFEIVSSYSSPNYEDVINEINTFKYAKGGVTNDEKGVDLFEDHGKNMPKNVFKILDKYGYAFEDGDYEGLRKARQEIEKIGYTFEFYINGQAYDLRKIGQKGKYSDYANGGMMEEGGENQDERALNLLNKLKEEGKLKRYLDVRGNGKKVFDIIVPNKKKKGMYKRYESLSQTSIGTLQNEYLDETDVLRWLKKTMPKREMANGGMMAKGGTTIKKGGKFGINDMVMVDDSGYIKLFTGFDTTKPAKIIDVNKVKTSRGTFYTYGLEFEGGEKPFNYAMENKLSLVQGGNMAKGGMVVTSIKDIPNFKEELEAGNITYRGLGLGKIYKDFYNLAGTNGFQIKVKNKQYFITDKEFDTVSRDKNTGKRLINFDAPYRKG